jgi:flagellar hook-basal body complex protein FliE
MINEHAGAELSRLSSATTQSRSSGLAASNEASPEPQSAFGSVLAGVLVDTAAALRTGEVKSLSAMRGDGSVLDAVEAVMRAEQQLQATLAIRDKIVAAYLDLSHQQI